MSRLSIVIATLGGEQLLQTIKSINSGAIVPDEIIVCIPEKEIKEKGFVSFDNVIFVATKVRGQVAQRCEGFKIAKGDFVIQIDDDILLENDCIEILIASMRNLGNFAVCSPALYFKETGNSVYQRPIKNTWLSKMYYWLLNGSKGYVEGIITKAGTEIGVNPDQHIESIVPTEWIPGGMAIHYHKNLIKENYFPYIGKAYSEDIYHSFALTQNGLKLYVITNAKAFIDDPRIQGIISLRSWLNNTKKDFKIRSNFIKISDKSYIRMLFFYAFSLIAQLVKLGKKWI